MISSKILMAFLNYTKKLKKDQIFVFNEKFCELTMIFRNFNLLSFGEEAEEDEEETVAVNQVG